MTITFPKSRANAFTGGPGLLRHCPCGTRLARDNRSEQCSACAKKDRFSRPVPPVPPEFWDDEHIGPALESRQMGAVIRAFRTHPFHRRDIIQEQMARWLNISPSRLSRIENGESVFDLGKLARWSRMLGIPQGHLWFHVNDESRESAGRAQAESRAVECKGAEKSQLAVARKIAGHTQETLAEAVGVSPRTVRSWESGENRPIFCGTHVRLVEALGITVTQLSVLLGEFQQNLWSEHGGSTAGSVSGVDFITALTAIFEQSGAFPVINIHVTVTVEVESGMSPKVNR
ncbi:helix-turn-helix domain-containing protein [Saccharothrix sp. Mg75]|uniref:helix-turn-helix domain-containing protein n=1 Tax=Saccharothrix sp. Mg75 TaxID=3445357 RepID=UPI003EECA0E5